MKKKELKNLAKKIADAEYIIQNSMNEYEKQQAKDDIFRYTSEINSFEELDLLDEMVQDYFNKI